MPTTHSKRGANLIDRLNVVSQSPPLKLSTIYTNYFKHYILTQKGCTIICEIKKVLSVSEDDPVC